MLEDFDWLGIKAGITYIEGDHVAVIRHDGNALSWEPTYYRQSDGACCIKRNGRYELVEAISGIERYERRQFKKLFDSSTGELIEVPG
jgi:hypothetical protein